MNTLNTTLLTSLVLLCSSLASAQPRASSKPPQASESKKYERRCQSRSPNRDVFPQGTLLWGTKHGWDTRPADDARKSVLVSVDATQPLQGNAGMTSLKVENGHLVAAPNAAVSLVGTVLQGTSSDGKPVEVTICGAEPTPEDPDLVWYRIEAWNPVALEWENPCVATGRVPDPRALAMRGTWDLSGAHQDALGRFTWACETGVITKCVRWGYKPWVQRDGQSLASLHQACTRMARADYCGDGRNHTRENTAIDMYDRLGVLTPTRESSPEWELSRASFEAAWSTDGATCLARTRDGKPLESVLQECPGRFRTKKVDLGGGDLCTAQRPEVSTEQVLLRNRSYEHP